MLPEQLDTLRCTGEIDPTLVMDASNHEQIAALCSLSSLMTLFLSTSTHFRLIAGRQKVTCYGECMTRNFLIKSTGVISSFVDQRLVLTYQGIVSNEADRSVSGITP